VGDKSDLKASCVKDASSSLDPVAIEPTGISVMEGLPRAIIPGLRMGERGSWMTGRKSFVNMSVLRTAAGEHVRFSTDSGCALAVWKVPGTAI